jgi:hypothetical protein
MFLSQADRRSQPQLTPMAVILLSKGMISMSMTPPVPFNAMLVAAPGFVLVAVSVAVSPRLPAGV